MAIVILWARVDVLRPEMIILYPFFLKKTMSRLPSYHFFYHETMQPISLSPEGILKLIEKLKLTSSAGPDKVNSRVLKNTCDIAS